MENVHELTLHLQRQLVVVAAAAIIVLLATKSTSSDDHQQPMMNIAKPGCPHSCGSVSIPYPFGTSPECYYDKSFLITCNQTSNNIITSHTSSQPFFPNSNVSILNISLENGELRAAGFISRHCYSEKPRNLSGVAVYYSENYTITNSTFPLSTRNKFTAVGCDTFGIVEGRTGKTYATGCFAFCDKIGEDADNRSCSGIGCCQMNIPGGVVDYGIGVQIGSVSNNSLLTYEDNPCGYAFVAEDSVYNFSWSDLKRLQKKDVFPVVLDWAISNLTCKEAMKNLTGSYACLASNSHCLDSTNPVGWYRCKCPDGFQGNVPYLPHGCQDVDECKSTPNLCNTTTSQCVNLPGSYTCSCFKGYKKDEWTNGRSCVPIDGGKDNSAEKFYIAILICICLLALLVGGTWVYWGLKKRRLIKLKQKFFEQNGGLLLQRLPSTDRGSTGTTKIFTADELNKATNNYDVKRVLGQGGYGTVYKGVLADNKVVAIKKSKIGNQSQIEQFINEVKVLSQINHRNVVKLLGCCLETEVPLLVYEFITNGTLFEHIHDTRGQYFQLSWEMRLKIAAETAGAIAYLHSSTSMPIIHRDIKTANILLDENYNAKVSDFGASRLVPLDQTQLTTLVQGTLGYLDPEYLHTSQLTEKSDVYSFGVVLAEILTSQKALSFQRAECDRNLATHFVSSMKEDHQLLRILDENLVNNENIVEQLKVVANVAKSCLRVRGEDRPTMKEVAIELEALKEKARIHPWEKDDHNLSSEETEHLLKHPGFKASMAVMLQVQVLLGMIAQVLRLENMKMYDSNFYEHFLVRCRSSFVLFFCFYFCLSFLELERI